MILKIGNLSYNVILNLEEITHKIPILFLHGFAGSSNDWNFLIDKLPTGFTPILIDLLGHGKTSSPQSIQEYLEESQVEQLKLIMDELAIHNSILVGYSMGGRLALSFSMRYPNFVRALVLESTSFGLASEIEREERIIHDADLANQIKELPLNDFFDFWYSIPLFESLKKLPSENINNFKQTRINSNNKIGLHNSLLGFSTGKMDYYLDRYNKLENKVLLIAGELDKKFSTISKKADKQNSNSELNLVKDCGHNVHLEKPKEFLKLLNTFLLSVQEK